MHTMNHYRLARLLDIIKLGPPNLDAMDEEELLSFYLTHRGGHEARLLFRRDDAGARTATDLLATYAGSKRKAIACQREGNVGAARHWEMQCERTYSMLPRFARW